MAAVGGAGASSAADAGTARSPIPWSPGRYTARLTVTPAGGGATTIINRSFNLTKDANQVMAESDLKSLDQFRLGYAKFQESLRPAQEQVDSMAAAYEPLKSAADRAGDKLTPALKTQLAQLDSAVDRRVLRHRLGGWRARWSWGRARRPRRGGRDPLPGPVRLRRWRSGRQHAQTSR